MKFGLYFAFRNPKQWFRPWEDIYAEAFQQMAYAEELGYDAVWLTEHHFVEDGYSPSVLPIASAAAVHTKRLLIGTFVILLPFYHPVRLAEDAATVDVISKGRFILGISAGYRASEFAGYGIRWEDRPGIMDEGLEVLKGCWTQDHYSFHGRHFNVHDVSIYPKPVQLPHPPVYYGGVTNASVRRFARLGFDGWAGGVPTMAGKMELFETEMSRYHRSPEQTKFMSLMWLYVGQDGQSAWADYEEHAKYVHRVYSGWTREASGRESPHGKVWDEDARRHFLGGDPEFAIRAIEKMVQETPYPIEHLVLGMQLPGMANDKMLRSMELFAAKVMPHFR